MKQYNVARSDKSLKEITILMYYSGVTLFKETQGIAKINLCFILSSVEMPTMIFDIGQKVLVRKYFVSIVIFITFSFLNSFF